MSTGNNFILYIQKTKLFYKEKYENKLNQTANLHVFKSIL